MTKWVYRFGNEAAEGRADMKNFSAERVPVSLR